MTLWEQLRQTKCPHPTGDWKEPGPRRWINCRTCFEAAVADYVREREHPASTRSAAGWALLEGERDAEIGRLRTESAQRAADQEQMERGYEDGLRDGLEVLAERDAERGRLRAERDALLAEMADALDSNVECWCQADEQCSRCRCLDAYAALKSKNNPPGAPAGQPAAPSGPSANRPEDAPGADSVGRPASDTSAATASGGAPGGPLSLLDARHDGGPPEGRLLGSVRVPEGVVELSTASAITIPEPGGPRVAEESWKEAVGALPRHVGQISSVEAIRRGRGVTDEQLARGRAEGRAEGDAAARQVFDGLVDDARTAVERARAEGRAEGAKWTGQDQHYHRYLAAQARAEGAAEERARCAGIARNLGYRMAGERIAARIEETATGPSGGRPGAESSSATPGCLDEALHQASAPVVLPRPTQSTTPSAARVTVRPISSLLERVRAALLWARAGQEMIFPTPGMVGLVEQRARGPLDDLDAWAERAREFRAEWPDHPDIPGWLLRELLGAP